jgi:glycosyltransferase involved in cell wall biosynthesis
MWEKFGVDSMHAYGDYDESCMFAIATGKVIQSFYEYHKLENSNVVALFNEWMLGMGELYVKLSCPKIATMFVTHATSIGRSIAGNNKDLYAYMDGYNGDQMARELNMEAKHSIEKQAAHNADCFATVSDLTARECAQLLDKSPDIVTPNGFEPNFVPTGKEYDKKRKEARKTLLDVASKLCGEIIPDDAFLVSTSGRCEFRNKGLDVFIDSISKIKNETGADGKNVVAFVMVPAWVYAARADLQLAIKENIPTESPMQTPFITHWLHNMNEDRVVGSISYHGFKNGKDDKVKLIFVPCYLDGKDGIFDKPYYDILIGMDATVYPSYYEPWGYTPLESIAFGIPTITTTLSGFGLWAKQYVSGDDINEGVAVIERNDSNYWQVCDNIAASLTTLMNAPKKTAQQSKKNSMKLAEKAEWSKFVVYYEKAFDIALRSSKRRNEIN